MVNSVVNASFSSGASSTLLSSSFLTTSKLKLTTILHLADSCLFQNPIRFSTVDSIIRLSTQVSEIKSALKQILIDNSNSNMNDGGNDVDQPMVLSDEDFQNCIQMIRKLDLFEVRCEEEALNRMGGRQNERDHGCQLPTEIQAKQISSSATNNNNTTTTINSSENRPVFKFWHYVAERFELMSNENSDESEASIMERLYQSLDPCTRMMINQLAAKQFDKVVKIVKRSRKDGDDGCRLSSSSADYPLVNISKFEYDNLPQPVFVAPMPQQLPPPPPQLHRSPSLYGSYKEPSPLQPTTTTVPGQQQLLCPFCKKDNHVAIDCPVDPKIKSNLCFVEKLCKRCLQLFSRGHQCSSVCKSCPSGSNFHHSTLCFGTNSAQTETTFSTFPSARNRQNKYSGSQILRFTNGIDDNSSSNSNDKCTNEYEFDTIFDSEIEITSLVRTPDCSDPLTKDNQQTSELISFDGDQDTSPMMITTFSNEQHNQVNHILDFDFEPQIMPSCFLLMDDPYDPESTIEFHSNSNLNNDNLLD